MIVNESSIVVNHGGYPNDRFGWVFDSGATGSAVASTIQTLITTSDVGAQPACEQYQYGDQDRWACATKVASDLGPVTVIAGLHHEKDDSAFIEPDCSDFTLTTTAQQVFESQSDANLEAYVKGVIGVVQQQTAAAMEAQYREFIDNGGSTSELQRDENLQMEFSRGVLKRTFSKVACFGTGDLKHGNIYSFIMSADPAAPIVLFNGNNFDLNGTTLELEDDQLSGEQNIARLFNQELGDPVNGASTYVNYHWDDPINPDDNVENFFENRKVPGTSCKRSYIEVANLNAQVAEAVAPILGVPAAALAPSFPPRLYIFGSGTYPGDDVCASDDGGACAIAGTGHTSQSTLLNLFLAASVLFSVVFLRRRV